MCNNAECAAKAAAKPRVPVLRHNRTEAVIQNTSGPESVRLVTKNHEVFVVHDGFVTATKGTVVFMVKGRVIANSGSTVIAAPGVEIVKAHKNAVILTPGYSS